MRLARIGLAAAMAGGLACAAEPPSTEEATASATPATASVEMLATPFSAEQIRDVWQPDLEIVMRQTTPDGTTWQRWRVVEADAEGCRIEYTPVDEAGEALGAPTRQRQTWTELRDHASFPAGEARREAVERETAIGRFEGWLYTVEDPESGEATELFFAEALPGAPLWLRLTQKGREIMTMEQVERTPAADG